MRNQYWHSRLERWGAWRVGAKGATIAPWARMRNGLPMNNAEPDRVPELHVEERETHELIVHLPKEQMRFLLHAYPWRVRLAKAMGVSRQTLEARIEAVHSKLARLLDQRRRGEALDDERPRPRAKVQRVTVQSDGQRIRLAAVAIDD